MSFLCQRAYNSSNSTLTNTFRHKSSIVRCLRPTPCSSNNLFFRPCSRPLSTSSRRSAVRTVQQAKARARGGPFSIWGAVAFLTAGIAITFYFRNEKARLDRQRIVDASKGVGKPKIGGDFTLLDQEGKTFTDEDMKGGYTLVYFGFSHCPDICPEELDKMANIIDLVASTSKNRISTSSFVAPSSSKGPLLPLFITCDPARDTPAVLKHYLAEFHPGLVGLTGTWEQVKNVCKKYRVYFSTPEGVKPGMDYLVDHSIYFYLMDPDGDFVEAIGRQHSAERAAKIIVEHMGDWEGGIKR